MVAEAGDERAEAASAEAGAHRSTTNRLGSQASAVESAYIEKVQAAGKMACAASAWCTADAAR